MVVMISTIWICRRDGSSDGIIGGWKCTQEIRPVMVIEMEVGDDTENNGGTLPLVLDLRGNCVSEWLLVSAFVNVGINVI